MEFLAASFIHAPSELPARTSDSALSDWIAFHGSSDEACICNCPFAKKLRVTTETDLFMELHASDATSAAATCAKALPRGLTTSGRDLILALIYLLIFFWQLVLPRLPGAQRVGLAFNHGSVPRTHSQPSMDELPGTIRLFDIQADGSLDDSEITLIPQPSSNPDDPLRWSPARRYWHATLVCFIAAFTAATANDAGSAADSQNTELGITYDQINNAAGVLFIAIGYMTLLLAPTVTLYGRRINYLICIAMGLGGAAWFARIYSSSDSIGSQFFVGASES